MLSGLFQGDHATPPATSSYTSRERRSTSAVGICAGPLAEAGCHPWAAPTTQDEALLRLLGPGMHRDPVTAGPYLHGAQALAHLHRGAPLPVQAVEGALPADETVPRHLAIFAEIWRQCGARSAVPGEAAPQPASHGTRWVVPCTLALATVSHHSSACRFRSASLVKRMLGPCCAARPTPFSTLPLAGHGRADTIALQNPPAGRSPASFRSRSDASPHPGPT